MTVEGVADFIPSYDRYFAVVRANTPELLELAYRLRYQVYCVENPFEEPGHHSDGREVDEDDDRSAHALLLHRSSGAVAGTVRVIMPPLGGSHRELPIERSVSPADRLRFQSRLPNRTAEISRFAVSKRFRRRGGDGLYPDAAFRQSGAGPAADHRRLMPYITFGLLRAVLGICLEHRITHLAAMMEPALIRILFRLGLVFEPLGGLVEHHGWRQPCVARLADLIQRSRDGGSLLWHYARQEMLRIESAPPPEGGDIRRNRRA